MRADDVGPGLRALVDAVWAPDRTGVEVDVGRRLVRPGAERYLVLPDARRARLLLPAGDLGAARRAVGAYRGLRTARAELWSRLIRGGALANPRLTARLVELRVIADADAPRLLPRLAEVVGGGCALALMTVRNPRPVSKPTIAVLDATGRPLCYAKVGRSPTTDAMVRTESAGLRAVAGRLPTVVTPLPLAELSWLGHPVSVLAPLPADAHRLTAEPLSMPDVLREIAATGELRTEPLARSPYLHRLHDRAAACASCLPDQASAVLGWADRIASRPDELEFGRSHGDWVSWNLGTSRGRVVAWDWEQSAPDAPVGFDACHWYFQRARAARGLRAAAAAVDQTAPGLQRLGVAAEATERVAEIYLLSALVADLESAAEGDSTVDLPTIAAIALAR